MSARAHRALAHGHAAGLRGGLQPGGHVDGVADHRVGVADGTGRHLSCVQTHPQRQGGAVGFGELLVDLTHRRLHRQPCPHRALRVVLVRDRRTKQRHKVVADVLVDGAAKPLHFLCKPP